MNKPTGHDENLWKFSGTFSGKEVELICIPCDNDEGCHMVGHFYDGHWIPNTYSCGAEYLTYSDMEGSWVILSQCVEITEDWRPDELIEARNKYCREQFAPCDGYENDACEGCEISFAFFAGATAILKKIQEAKGK